jgi:hypothetical protein
MAACVLAHVHNTGELLLFLHCDGCWADLTAPRLAANVRDLHPEHPGARDCAVTVFPSCGRGSLWEGPPPGTHAHRHARSLLSVPAG